MLRDQPIRRQVVAITCMLLVPFVAAALWSANRSRKEHLEELRQQAASVVVTAAAYLNTYLAGVDSMASALTRYPAVIALDKKQIDPLLEAVLRDQPLILTITVTDAAGEHRGSALPTNALRALPFTMPFIQEVVRTGKPLVTGLVVGQISRQPTVLLVYPVRNVENTVVGVLGISLNVARLQTLFSDIPLPDGSVVTLSDKSSRVIARSRDAELYIGKLADPNPIPPREVPRTQVRTGLDGVTRSYGNAVVERGPWLLSIGIPTRVAIERMLPLVRRNATIVLSSISAILLLSLMLSNSMTRGVDTLRAAVQRIADGDLRRRSARRSPNRELAQLQDSFITMAANLREAHGRSITRWSRSGRCARRCSRCSGRSSARSGLPPSACSCPAWRTS